MSKDFLRREIDAGVEFWGFKNHGRLVGVMGIQDRGDVTLIRYAYVRTANRNQGIGGRLLSDLTTLTDQPVLAGAWKAAAWPSVL
ncbi:MAG: GNAT family N-acetyltransferase [Candidatus Omnitrophica bacterium]|nr:GNAT family N-acetyltransferase [Candidatus Omnitrophota bacterium]